MSNEEFLNCKCYINPNIYYIGKERNRITGEIFHLYERIEKGKPGYIDWIGDE